MNGDELADRLPDSAAGVIVLAGRLARNPAGRQLAVQAVEAESPVEHRLSIVVLSESEELCAILGKPLVTTRKSVQK